MVTLTINLESPWGNLYARLAIEGDPIFRHSRLYAFREVKKFLIDSGFELLDCISTLISSPSELEEGVNIVSGDEKAGVTAARARRI